MKTSDPYLNQKLRDTFGVPTPPLDEILRHKWLESEKLGRDVGLLHSIHDWKARHYEGWRQALLQQPKTAHLRKSKELAHPQTRSFRISVQENQKQLPPNNTGLFIRVWSQAALRHQMGRSI